MTIVAGTRLGRYENPLEDWRGAPAPAALSDQERAVFDALRKYGMSGSSSYFVMLTARPQAVGYGLTDSPAGLAAFLLVHSGFAKWSYGDDPTKTPTKDQVLDDFTLYWLTNTSASAGRLYWENVGRNPTQSSVWKTTEISLPVAITVFPEDVYRPPETWARRAYKNLIYFHEVDKGGHFAAWGTAGAFLRRVARRLQIAPEPAMIANPSASWGSGFDPNKGGITYVHQSQGAPPISR